MARIRRHGFRITICFLAALCPLATAIGGEGRFGIRGLYQPDRIEKAALMAKECGVSWTRIRAIWDEIEPQKGRFHWKDLDRVVAGLAAHDINVLITVRGYNRWASSRAKTVPHERKPRRQHRMSAPPDPVHIGSYKAFLRNLVERYDGDSRFGDQPPPEPLRSLLARNPVKHWQIENEPGGCEVHRGSGFWNGTARELAELFMVAADAVREADPGAKIVLSGFAAKPMTRCCGGGYPLAVLQEFRKHGFEFDIFDIHNYRDVPDIYEQVACARGLLVEQGYAKVNIWMTETGFDRRSMRLGYSRREYYEQRAVSMIKRHVVAFSLGIQKVFQWTLTDKKGAVWPPKRRLEIDRFRGIVDADLSPKPIYGTYRLMVSKLDDFTAVDDVSRGPHKVFRFTVRGKTVIVAWNGGGGQPLSVGLNQVRLTDPFGNVSAADGRSLRVTGLPVFIE